MLPLESARGLGAAAAAVEGAKPAEREWDTPRRKGVRPKANCLILPSLSFSSRAAERGFAFAGESSFRKVHNHAGLKLGKDANI